MRHSWRGARSRGWLGFERRIRRKTRGGCEPSWTPTRRGRRRRRTRADAGLCGISPPGWGDRRSKVRRAVARGPRRTRAPVARTTATIRPPRRSRLDSTPKLARISGTDRRGRGPRRLLPPLPRGVRPRATRTCSSRAPSRRRGRRAGRPRDGAGGGATGIARAAAAVARGLRRGDEASRARGRGRVPGAGASRGEAVQRAAGVPAGGLGRSGIASTTNRRRAPGFSGGRRGGVRDAGAGRARDGRGTGAGRGGVRRCVR